MVEIENLKVSEMRVEYFPPKEEVILRNEAPTDIYIFVNGAAVRNYTPISIHLIYHLNGTYNIIILQFSFT